MQSTGTLGLCNLPFFVSREEDTDFASMDCCHFEIMCMKATRSGGPVHSRMEEDACHLLFARDFASDSYGGTVHRCGACRNDGVVQFKRDNPGARGRRRCPFLAPLIVIRPTQRDATCLQHDNVDSIGQCTLHWLACRHVASSASVSNTSLTQ